MRRISGLLIWIIRAMIAAWLVTFPANNSWYNVPLVSRFSEALNVATRVFPNDNDGKQAAAMMIAKIKDDNDDGVIMMKMESLQTLRISCLFVRGEREESGYAKCCCCVGDYRFETIEMVWSFRFLYFTPLSCEVCSLHINVYCGKDSRFGRTMTTIDSYVFLKQSNTTI